MARVIQGPTTASGDAALAWIGDYLSREHLMPGGARLSAAAFQAADAVRVNVTAAAVAGATSITVTALSGPIPTGTLLDFGGAKFARLSAAAATGATTLAVDAIPTALAVNDVAYYSPSGAVKRIASGTAIGRTYAERDANAAFGPAADTDDEVYLLAFDVTDVATNADCELYRPGSLVKENFLPGWAGLTATVQGKIRSAYRCTRGAV